MKNWKKVLSAVLALVMMLALLTACGSNAAPAATTTAAPAAEEQAPATTETTPAEEAAAPVAVEDTSMYAADQTLKLLYSIEVSEWNYLVYNAAGDWANYIDNLIEYDNYGRMIGALAESWEVSDDNLTYTFHIRPGVQWQYSDGSAYGAEVSAEDWVTAAKYVLDPANAAATADYMFTIAGAEEYYNALAAGEEADFETVGVKATDASTLVYTLKAPCSYFLSTLTFNWGYPVNAQYLEEMGEDFGIDPFTFLYCGAFLCNDYQPESYRYDVKNESYWDAEHVYITAIDRTFNAEAETIGPEMFLRGEVTYTKIPNTQIQDWLGDPAKLQYVQPLTPARTSYWFAFNFWPTYDGSKYDIDSYLMAANNVDFRMAFYYGLNRTAVSAIYNSSNPDALTLNTITPDGFGTANGKDYTENGSLAQYTNENQFNTELALEYMAKAVEALKAEGAVFPIQIYMPYRSTDANQTSLAQVVEQQLENLFGSDIVDIILEGYPGTDYKNLTSRCGNYSFMLLWWGPDFADPVTYTEPFKVGGKYSYIYMANGEATLVAEGEGTKGFDGGYWTDYTYDQMVAAAKQLTNDDERLAALAEAEAWLIENAYVIPCGLYDATGYAASYLNPFEKEYVFSGACQYKYKFQHIWAEAMDAEAYGAARTVWEAERSAALAG